MITKKFNRDFGLLISAILFFLSVFEFFQSNSIYFLILSALTLIAALKKPSIFKPFSFLWKLIGELIGFITRPLILAVIFYLLLSPLALVLKLIGRDYLNLKTNNKSYWISRRNTGKDLTKFEKQY